MAGTMNLHDLHTRTATAPDVARLRLTAQAFTQAHGCRTHSMKLNRIGVLVRFGSSRQSGTT